MPEPDYRMAINGKGQARVIMSFHVFKGLDFYRVCAMLGIRNAKARDRGNARRAA